MFSYLQTSCAPISLNHSEEENCFMQEPYKDFLVRKSCMFCNSKEQLVQQVEDPPEIHRRAKKQKTSVRRKQPEVSWINW